MTIRRFLIKCRFSFFFVWVGCFASYSVYGQTPLFPNDSLTRNPQVQMNPIRISSGVLEDYGSNELNFRHYNGQSLTDSNSVNYEVFSIALQAVRNSSFNQSSFPVATTYSDSLSQVYRRGNNPVNVLFYKYNYLKDNALSDSLVVQRPNLIIEDRYDNQGNWINPYDSSYVFCFAPYMSFSKDEVCFYFRNDFRVSNHPISAMSFDPDDGAGYRTISLQGATTVSVDYNACGSELKNLKLKIILADNTELIAHSIYTIVASNTLPSYSPRPRLNQADPVIPGDSLTFTALNSYYSYQPCANVYVVYADGRSSLQRPLIYVEGFEPVPDLSELLSNSGNIGMGTMKYDSISYLPDSIRTHYDIVYIDWQQSFAPIEANADILKQVIQWVNTNKTTTEKNVVLGYSMGGLIARYALCQMEDDNTPHDVKTFISYDSPHFGINIPTGYLFAARHFIKQISESYLVKLADDIKCILDFLGVEITLPDNILTPAYGIINYLNGLSNAPSVRQMLEAFVTPTLSIDNSMYWELQHQLNQWGMPSGDAGSNILNLTISNGGVNDYIAQRVQQNMFCLDVNVSLTALAQALIKNYLISMCLRYSPDIVPYLPIIGQASQNLFLQIKSNIFAGNTVFDVGSSFYKKGIFHGYKVNHSATYQSSPYYDGLDDSYGSYVDFSIKGGIIGGQFDDYIMSPGTMGSIYFIYSPPVLKFPLVPTVSSLAYKESRGSLTSEDFRKDYRQSGNLDFSLLPFDGYHLPDSACNHILPTPRDSAILWADRMQDFHWGAFPSSPTDGSTFTVVDDHPEKYDASNPIVCTWSTSDNTKATVTSSGTYAGTLHIGFGGPVTIYADIQHRGGHLILKHYVDLPLSPFQGFPNYSLSVEDGLPNQNGVVENYIVTATALSSLPDSVTRRMTYRWGIKRNTTDQITWTSLSGIFGPNPSKMYNIPEAANCRMVYFYATYGSYQSPTYSICCWPSSYIILMNPEGYMYVPGDGDPIIQVKGLGGGATVMYDDKQIPFNHTPTVSEICTEMVKDDSFVQLLKTLKPWGTEEMLLIPYQLCQEGKEPEQQFICVLYKDFSL